MLTTRYLACLGGCLLGLFGASVATPTARADTAPCAPIVQNGTLMYAGATPSEPGVGNAGCWTDLDAGLPGSRDPQGTEWEYPFGSDGSPVDPNESLCARQGQAAGRQWQGDFNPEGDAVPGNPPCYLQVNSLAFRAWNRGLASTGQPSNFNAGAGTVAFGVWLYNGTDWFPDPTFPGSSVCPGSVVLWAGKLDYWLVGPAQPGGLGQTTLCRFDGVNLEWEPLSLPAAAVARLPTNSLGKPVGGITTGACYAWNNCWFFGDDGIEVHWDGQALSNASTGLGNSPWLEADATAAVAGTDPSGNPFGLAVAKSTMTLGVPTSNGAAAPVPAAPGDSSAPAQVFASQGGPWTSTPYTPPASAQPNDPFTTDLTAVSADTLGDVWIAGDPSAPATVRPSPNAPAPLQRLTDSGAPVCTAQGPNGTPFTYVKPNGYQWEALSTLPGGSALAGARYENSATQWGDGLQPTSVPDVEPQLIEASCGESPEGGQASTEFEFRRPDPLGTDQDPSTAAYSIPADLGGNISAVAATSASNMAWAATTDGNWEEAGSPQSGVNGAALAPHLYLWTDGQPPNAPAGDDNEPRPSLFTIGPPVYVVGSATIVVTPVVTTTTTTKGKTKKRKLLPAVYDVHEEKLEHVSGAAYILYFSFKVRRPVTIGLEGLRGHTVVASTGLKHFSRHTGVLALTLNRDRWPTRLSFVTPKKTKK